VEYHRSDREVARGISHAPLSMSVKPGFLQNLVMVPQFLGLGGRTPAVENSSRSIALRAVASAAAPGDRGNRGLQSTFMSHRAPLLALLPLPFLLTLPLPPLLPLLSLQLDRPKCCTCTRYQLQLSEVVPLRMALALPFTFASGDFARAGLDQRAVDLSVAAAHIRTRTTICLKKAVCQSKFPKIASHLQHMLLSSSQRRKRSPSKQPQLKLQSKRRPRPRPPPPRPNPLPQYT